MKKLFITLCSLFIFFSASLYSQNNDENAYVPTRLKNYKALYEHTFNNNFIDVWNGIVGYFSKENIPLQTKSKNQNADGKFKATIRTDFVIFALGSERDTSFKAMDKISKEPILIRGGIWTSARMQYLIRLKENPDGTVYMSLKGTASGFEKNVTQQIQEYESNGNCEVELIEKLINAVNEIKH